MINKKRKLKSKIFTKILTKDNKSDMINPQARKEQH